MEGWGRGGKGKEFEEEAKGRGGGRRQWEGDWEEAKGAGEKVGGAKWQGCGIKIFTGEEEEMS